jgi:hypothetical protein
MNQPAFRPLTVGEILDQAFGLYRTYLPVLVTITVVCTMVPLLGLSYLEVVSADDPATAVFEHIWIRLLLVVVITILSGLALGASTLVLTEGYLGRTISTGEALKRATKKLRSIIGVSIEISLAFGLGLILLVIPGIIVICGYAVSTQALMVEPELKMQSAMARSWALTKGSRLRVFAVLAVTGIVLLAVMLGSAGVIALGLRLIGVSPGTVEESSRGYQIALEAGNIVFRTILMPLVTCVLTVLYFDLRVRAEGFDLEALAASLPLT